MPYRADNTDVGAKSNDPDTWSSYEQAQRVADENEEYEIGFVFSENDDIIGVDLDHVRDPNTREVEDWAREVIDRLDSYTEISPSGTGYHILVRGSMPSGRKRHGNVEMYDNGRFFTVTKNRVPDTEYHVKEREGAIKVVHHKYLKREEKKGSEENTATPDPDSISMSDKEVLRRAKDSRNGDAFEALWSGDTAGYDSQSEADAALCSKLAFWTGGDPEQMDRIFRASGLYRDKWDAEHSGDGKTYGEMTIEFAIRTSNDFYGQES